ncbi:Rrf2/aminotransferase, class V family protein [Neorickettsia risticii str. Illinois]|uniref:Rrf2/aminotransferase, class V family protein n=1 Tax=Neorickettsia risticii (strain Illinois) TaxID=434131 RepID=C6V4G6_NEORI|nr:aminotransferase class V-fold PLP-dependent enzyme [Neorickettsia risticii]ACT69286.1 Rrf2/aminotransferase, class V family protein [Neorickettsia risticii str. Illinois]
MLTAKTRYAIVASIDIALHSKGRKYVKTSEIASRQKISEKFLEVILPPLKKQGILESLLGPGGGYRLAKEPDTIFLMQILKAVADTPKITRCGGDGQQSCTGEAKKCCTHNLWVVLEKRFNNFFESVTLQDIISDDVLRQEKNVHNGSTLESYQEDIIYMDNNATATPFRYAVEKACTLLKLPYNASSIHRRGQAAREVIEEARRLIKKNLNLEEDYDLVFTASGTEANNMLFHNASDYQHIVCSTDHSSTLKVANNPIQVDVDENGIIKLESLKRALLENHGCKLVSVCLANSETGVIQPLDLIMEIAKEHGALVHADATQAISRIHCRFNETQPDFITFSAHKMGGIIGAGCLAYRKYLSKELKPLILGGGQERNLRSGTENLAAIAAFGNASMFINTSIKNMKNIRSLRDYMEDEISKRMKSAVIVGQKAQRLPNTSCIIIPEIDGTTQLMHFDMHGICVSNGSACSSGQLEASHVLLAMGFDNNMAKSAIRISLGISNTKEEVKKLVSTWEILYNIRV